MNEQLPDGWVEVELDAIGQTVTGTTPSKAIVDYYGGDVPFVKPSDLKDDIVSQTDETLTEKGSKQARLLPAYSTLVSCIGILGKTALNDRPVAFNQQINAVIPNTFINPKYVFYYCQSKIFEDKLTEASSSTTIAIVNKSRFSKLTLPLPPLAEQARIVAALDGLLGRVRSAQEQLATVPKLLKGFRQAVLSAAVSGKLTEDWREEKEDLTVYRQPKVDKWG